VGRGHSTKRAFGIQLEPKDGNLQLLVAKVDQAAQTVWVAECQEGVLGIILHQFLCQPSIWNGDYATRRDRAPGCRSGDGIRTHQCGQSLKRARESASGITKLVQRDRVGSISAVAALPSLQVGTDCVA
jgi:hypothetical protein